jgi:hypothetical protein
VTPATLLTDGEHEHLKAAWHGALLALAGGAALYNTAAFVRRPSAHLAFGAVVYTVLAFVEKGMVERHLRTLRNDYAESRNDDLLSRV